jgi:nucleotidyltransferase/DNA polymerase involved in DNA repair
MALRANEILGVGHSTEKSLRALGIFTIGDLANTPQMSFLRLLASTGRYSGNMQTGLTTPVL